MSKLAALLLLAVVIGMGANVQAAETFSPTPADMYDLDHNSAYTWNFNLGFKTSDMPITEATLTFTNIRNWQKESNVLYIHLMDPKATAKMGTKVLSDYYSSGDYFKGKGILVDAWKDGVAPDDFKPQTLSYTFDGELLAALNLYGQDGKIGFGFDPDCHYYNDGITFTVSTFVAPATIAPAPGAILLAGVGTMLVGWLRRRKSI